MFQTNCILDEKDVPITFSRVFTQGGEYFKGVLFSQPVIEFNFTIANHDTNYGAFHPADLPLPTKKAIFSAVKEYEITPEDSENGFLNLR